ncbi:6-pyruvoyl trahydropterin synthase family protein [Flavihumibacter sp. UBA7668]|uniref:6-pyruvoyl trahydropterin synthase family protein n=1 Tax=Flavihumibacter sp. UBA7668 TaxID=1946542 RepID=UPI0025C26FFC|nr:6-carboxytetrahydropterin synthase [Flavihumibacter sp. UBA7668]
MTKKVAIYRKEHFNAAHRLYRSDWDDAQNFEVFGKCSYPHYHGHNYDLEVKVLGEPDPVTGFVMDMKLLSDIIQREVLNQFDHRNLNLDTPYFKEKNPTAENIAVVIYDLLRPHIDPKHELGIRLFETERNFVEYPGK